MYKSKKRKIFSVFTVLSVIVFSLTLAALFSAQSSYKTADIINGGVSSVYRRIMAAFGDLFPFSLFEIATGTLMCRSDEYPLPCHQTE